MKVVRSQIFLENIPYFQLYISALYKQAVIDLSINIKKF